ncbi:hypothetical protein AAG570_006011 [Ranatra chinensis]|uniref:Proteasome assembly chaperone 3 n=1 Tax=Ranatra chinensis TaxID=642074 RepID=A0ABD0XWS7_9HEMI
MVFRTSAAVIDGTMTDLVVSDFDDGLLIVVSQYKKPGAFFRVQKMVVDHPQDMGDGSPQAYAIRTMFGSDFEDRLFSAANFLAEDLLLPDNTVISLALRDSSPKVLKIVSQMIRKNKTW